MSFFKNLFGKSENKQDNGKPDIASLLASSDTNKSIIELDNYICKLCSWGDSLELLTKAQKNFYFNQNLEREINNGGFYQYFFNSSGEFAHETIISLQTISATKTADILQLAVDQFPNSKVPKDGNERKVILEQIKDNAFDELDQRFYKYEDNLNELNIDYVRKNRAFF